MAKFLLETKHSRFTVREEVEGINSFAALSQSRLALKPFQDSVEQGNTATLVVTNRDNTKEVLTINYTRGK